MLGAWFLLLCIFGAVSQCRGLRKVWLLMALQLCEVCLKGVGTGSMGWWQKILEQSAGYKGLVSGLGGKASFRSPGPWDSVLQAAASENSPKSPSIRFPFPLVGVRDPQFLLKYFTISIVPRAIIEDSKIKFKEQC